ncbi:hypothetical protein [Phaeobacter inhibens]|uniref:hypothetical protein n=1 Tax=Phaeobacter inhibens TaxID=221822 RepID=UPI000CA09F81|nr:hypothetical protein [Phaeobacter inhibens]AUQ65940.1 hypothetical protein PhaeoP78_01059 [Phaeobacter inhibens]
MGNVDRRNVIVVGAGASKEFNLPTGAELKSRIARICDIRFDDWGSKLISGDYEIVETLRAMVRNASEGASTINPYLTAGWQIRDNMPLAPSIDNFLDTHRDNPILVQFGKLAIAKAISEAEKASSLFHSDSGHRRSGIDFNEIRNTWLAQLFGTLVAQRDFNSFLVALQNITFVSFNYDRCIHQFFFHAARQYFSLSDEQVEEMLTVLNILYPYGSIGDFSWRSSSHTNFGTSLSGEKLVNVSSELRTFTEGSGTDRVKRIRKSFEQADVVMFMGFGFLNLNIDLLLGKEIFEVERVLATGKGLSTNSRLEVVRELKEAFVAENSLVVEPLTVGDSLQVMDCTCGDLVFEFQRFLTN